LNFRLEKVLRRLHILQGLLVAYLNLDDVINIIRTEDEPKQVLMQSFALSDTQADAILDLKLRHLAKLEEIKIRGEQTELEKEREKLQGILASERKLSNLLKREIEADVAAYGDPRRSPLVVRGEAKAISEHELVSSEPMTIVLSTMGWVRSAKGHDIDPSALSYKSGDTFLSAVRGKSSQPVVFIDSTGRSYALEPSSLPSARGQGEPLTGKLTLPPGATVDQMITAASDQKLLLASDAGYGFVCSFDDLVARNRAGKTLLSLPGNAKVMPPLKVNDQEDAMLLVVTEVGRLLLFPVGDLPQLSKGKGNKIISIAAADAAAGKDRLTWLMIVSTQATVTLFIGKRKLILRPEELKAYRAERGRKGTLLPRGLQHVDRIEVNDPLAISGQDEGDASEQ
jgi:topoisomerase-4 subunit A